MAQYASEQLTLKGYLKGHTNWVTQIATNPQYPELLFSASRDKSLICWQLTKEDPTGCYGKPQKRLSGHNNFISDVAISSDGQFALTSSWDKSLRLWDLNALVNLTSLDILLAIDELFKRSHCPFLKFLLSELVVCSLIA